MRFTGQRVLVLVVVLLMATSTAVLAGDFWQYGEFNKNSETYRYEITTNKYFTTYVEDTTWEGEDGETTTEEETEYPGEFVARTTDEYGSEIIRSVESNISYYETKISKENGQMNFKITNEWDVPEEDFYKQEQMERLVSFLYGQYFNLPMMEMAGTLASNSMMFLMSVENLELEVGMMMSTWDGGMVKVTGMQSVAGQDGYVCDFLKKAEDETGKNVRKKISEWIINPMISMPLSIKVFDEKTGDLLSSMVLVNYKAVE